jgi:hypothetical protein
MPHDPLADTFPVVVTDDACRDPALDYEAMGYAKLQEYRRTRDPALLAFKPGAAPRWFHLRRLPRARVAALQTITAGPMRQIAMVLNGVASFDDPAGPQTPDPRAMTDVGRGLKAAGEEWWERIGDVAGNEGVYELGDLVEQAGSLAKGQHGPFVFRDS